MNRQQTPETYTESGKLPVPSQSLTGKGFDPHERFIRMMQLLRAEYREGALKTGEDWTVTGRHAFGRTPVDVEVRFTYGGIAGLYSEVVVIDGEEVGVRTRNGALGWSDPDRWNRYDKVPF